MRLRLRLRRRMRRHGLGGSCTREGRWLVLACAGARDLGTKLVPSQTHAILHVDARPRKTSTAIGPALQA